VATLLAAVNALGANQRELAEGQRQLRSDVAALKDDLAGVENTLADTNARVRSMEEGQAEIKDLLARALDSK
jgi:predicted  nucleic acid-binding Zn-ribbon protein